MMEEEEQNRIYVLDVQKLMSSDVSSTYWSHNMDLLVIVTEDNLLELYRISFKAQKVFQIEQDKEINPVSFSPDSKLLAYGMSDGEIKVLKTENGQTLLTVSDPISELIYSFNFIEFGQFQINSVLPFKQKKLIEKLILPISPHKNCNKSSIIKINYFNQLPESTPFNLLFSSSQKHTSIYLNGFITIAQLNYDMIAAKHGLGDNYSIYHSHYNADKKQVENLLIQNKPDRYVLHHVRFQSSILNDMQSDIIKFNSLLSYVSEIFAYVQSAYPAADLLVKDITRQYKSKINLIDFADPAQNQTVVNPCQELFKYLNCGITTEPLINFLTKEVYDTKLLQKLDQTLNGTFNNLHDLILQSIQNSLQRAFLLIKQLKNLVSLQNYKVFGIKENELQKMEEHIQKLYMMGQILLVESTQAKFDIRNLLVWLNKATIKSSPDQDPQIQNAKSYLSRYTVDFTRLHAFLQNQNKFTLQHLKWFFQQSNQQRSLIIPTAEFRLFSKTQNRNIKNIQEYTRNTQNIEALLGIDDIVLEQEKQKMEVEIYYHSFKLQVKTLKDDWKTIKVRPVIQISKIIQAAYTINKIGQVEASELFEFQVKTLVKKEENEQNALHYYYFVQRPPALSNSIGDVLVQYNSSTGERKTIKTQPSCRILSISVGESLLALIENSQNMEDEKEVVEIINQQWNGQLMQIGQKIQKLNGQILLNAGMRGLHCIIMNKNKLVVFSSS